MSQPKISFTARSPLDLVAVAPLTLGFRPADSVVLLTFGPGEQFHARVDLPPGSREQAEVVAMLAEVVARHAVGRIAILLYTDDAAAALRFHDRAVPRFLGDGVEVIDVLRVTPDRFHAAAEPEDPGTPYDLSTHPFTAQQVVRGQVVHDSRADLAALLECRDQADARAVDEASRQLEEHLLALTRFARPDRVCADLADHGRWVQRTIRRHVRLGTPLSADDAGHLLLLTSFVPLRDVAWSEMSRDEAARHLELWSDLVRRCPPDLLPAPAALLAFAAWLDGQGALAWCALDRCAEVDPDYSMSDCVAQLLEAAVPPSVWTPIAESELPVFWPPPDVEAS
jgi:hypothetical protein